MSLFDSAKLALDCPGCGQKIEETLGRLKHSPTLDCPNCHASIQIDAKQLNEGMSRTDAAMAELQQTLQNFGKR